MRFWAGFACGKKIREPTHSESEGRPRAPIVPVVNAGLTVHLPTFPFRLYIARAHRGGIAMEIWPRRKFFLTSLASSFAAGAGRLFAGSLPAGAAALPAAPVQGTRPIIIF